MGDARIKRGWGGSMTPAGSGTYRGGTSRATRAGGYRKRTGAVSGLNSIIKKTERAAAPKGLSFRHASVGGAPINPKLGGRDVGGRRTPWRKRKILE